MHNHLRTQQAVIHWPIGKLILTSVVMVLAFLSFSVNAQQTTSKGHTYVDNKGIIRWQKGKEEVQGFGVNYTVPFAHAYRSAKRLGIDPKEAIDNDVYHFSRLGFDLFRVHVWDTEISDTLGNLLQNEHLDAFDYLIQKLKDKGINYVITPIAFWGNGWPERDEPTPGFSYKYGKDKSLTTPGAIKAGQIYLAQFLNHINPYTQTAYKDDPSVIAFEVSNEPHHSGDADEVTAYVKGMIDAMKKTGTKKPIFYNISHSIQFEESYFKGGAEGGTFQWYPTGLTYQKELSGNLLPNASKYDIPFDDVIKRNKGAKIVYEFDAADIGKSYMYPALARGFREAGMQIATQFAYDPTYLAYANTEYNTHYMNLAYTPQKALSLMIAGEVFHKIPMNKDFGVYPTNNKFGDFEVNYYHDLAQYNGGEKFIYTNTNSTKPKDEAKLKQIAGYGNSTLVEYDGQGAYFIDKVADGVWRLEIMPDAIWVDNPFGKNSPKKTVAVINWMQHNLKLKLKNLGTDFEIQAINDGNSFAPKINKESFSIMPGTYILTKAGIVKNWRANDKFGFGQLKDFYAPEATVSKTWFKHESPIEVTESQPLELTVQIVAPTQPKKVELMISGFRGGPIEMIQTDTYHYKATIPADRITAGNLSYNIITTTEENQSYTYPSGLEGRSFDWDFYDQSSYDIRVAAKESSILLYNTKDDSGNLLLSKWSRGFRVVPLDNPWESEYQMNIGKIANENGPIDFTFKHFLNKTLAGRSTELASKKEIVIKGRGLNDRAAKLQVAFVLSDGASYGAIIELGSELQEYRLKLSDLKPVKTVTMPRPYPDFLAYYLDHNITQDFDISRIESIQFSIGPSLNSEELNQEQGIGLVSVWLK